LTVEISFPFEFNVFGTPVSLQAKRAVSRLAWKQRVKDASQTALPEGHFSTTNPLSVTLFYFPSSEMQGDVDNIVKPVLDALRQHIYQDDRQLSGFGFRNSNPVEYSNSPIHRRNWLNLSRAKSRFWYVRLATDLTERLA
jgi:hypothetical protein